MSTPAPFQDAFARWRAFAPAGAEPSAQPSPEAGKSLLPDVESVSHSPQSLSAENSSFRPARKLKSAPPPRVPTRDQILGQLALTLFQPAAAYDPTPLLHRLRVAAFLLRHSDPPAAPSAPAPAGGPATREISMDEIRAHARIADYEQQVWKPAHPTDFRPQCGLPDFALRLEDCICQSHPACAPAASESPPPSPPGST